VRKRKPKIDKKNFKNKKNLKNKNNFGCSTFLRISDVMYRREVVTKYAKKNNQESDRPPPEFEKLENYRDT